MSDKRPKRPTIYHDTDNAVEIEGIKYPFGQLPEKERARLALRGYAAFLLQQDDPQLAHHEIVKGGMSVIRAGKSDVLDPWREAAAHVYAEHAVRAAGIKPPPGKKHRDTPEFRAELEKARKTAAGWSKAQLAEAKAHPDVVREHGALTGKAPGLAGLFAPAVEAEPEAETKFEEAA